MNNTLNINKMKNLNFKTMRKLVFTLVMLLTLSLNAQDDYAVRFLGIPVDGSKSDMISKLEEKGFVYNFSQDQLTGSFNGMDVIVSVVEYKDKVYRILVADAFPSNETDIVIRYNNLIEQFERNEKYVGENEMIDANENIHYEMSQHNKRYEATYSQKSENDPDLKEFEISIPYSDVNDEFVDGFHNNCVDIAKSMGDDYYENVYIKGINDIQNLNKEQLFEYDKNWLYLHQISLQLAIQTNRIVWFMINEEENAYRKYRILLYYDNGFNMPNGEDL